MDPIVDFDMRRTEASIAVFASEVLAAALGGADAASSVPAFARATRLVARANRSPYAAQKAGRRKLEDARDWSDLGEVKAIADASRHFRHVDVALCVPATLIERAARAVPGFTIGAQDVHEADKGAHTGCLPRQC